MFYGLGRKLEKKCSALVNDEFWKIDLVVYLRESVYLTIQRVYILEKEVDALSISVPRVGPI